MPLSERSPDLEGITTCLATNREARVRLKEALILKGLRLEPIFNHPNFMSERSPDLEGITTRDLNTMLLFFCRLKEALILKGLRPENVCMVAYPQLSERSPDLEGITTWDVLWPTWRVRGLKEALILKGLRPVGLGRLGPGPRLKEALILKGLRRHKPVTENVRFMSERSPDLEGITT